MEGMTRGKRSMVGGRGGGKLLCGSRVPTKIYRRITPISASELGRSSIPVGEGGYDIRKQMPEGRLDAKSQ